MSILYRNGWPSVSTGHAKMNGRIRILGGTHSETGFFKKWQGHARTRNSTRNPCKSIDGGVALKRVDRQYIDAANATLIRKGPALPPSTFKKGNRRSCKWLKTNCLAGSRQLPLSNCRCAKIFILNSMAGFFRHVYDVELIMILCWSLSYFRNLFSISLGVRVYFTLFFLKCDLNESKAFAQQESVPSFSLSQTASWMKRGHITLFFFSICRGVPFIIISFKGCKKKKKKGTTFFEFKSGDAIPRWFYIYGYI